MIYVVTSLRQYCNDETYFGCDSVFSTRHRAEEYVREDMQELISEDPDLAEYADKENYTINAPESCYKWEIEPIIEGYATVTLQPDDVIDAAANDGVDLTEEQAIYWLKKNEKSFREQLTQWGNEMLSMQDWSGLQREC